MLGNRKSVFDRSSFRWCAAMATDNASSAGRGKAVCDEKWLCDMARRPPGAYPFHMRVGVLAGLPLVFVSFVAVGCVRAESAADRHIVEMRETMGKVETEQDVV